MHARTDEQPGAIGHLNSFEVGGIITAIFSGVRNFLIFTLLSEFGTIQRTVMIPSFRTDRSWANSVDPDQTAHW